ncbi:glycosyltransferase family 4 protein [Symmachiella dynata]|nr:glycosyltransferase family 4 protein [Symmachiella dynata]
MPRIAICFEYPTLNGGERSMLAVLDALRTEATDFVMLAPAEGPLAAAILKRGWELIPLRLRDATGQRLTRDAVMAHLLEVIAQSRADLVHANSLAMGRLTGAIAAQLKIPCTAHIRDILRLSRAAITDLNRNSQIVAVSQATRTFHVRQGLVEERSQVIHNGIDTDAFQPRAASGWLHQELGLPPRTLLVATIGQIGLRKGQDVLAAAARALPSEFADVHYLLIGERNSSKQENIDFDESLAGQFPAGRFHRLDVRDDVPQLLTEIDLLVHPARQEPFGRVLLEAAACGRAIVATDVGGTAEMLTHGESALLVPADDATALAATMGELLGNEALRHQLGAAARARIEADFTIDRAATQLRDVWMKQTSRRKP